MNNLVCTVRIMFHVSRLNQSHMRRRRFWPLSAELILRTACELSLYIFIHCQGMNFALKVRGMIISSNLLLEIEVKGVLLVPRPHTGSKQ